MNKFLKLPLFLAVVGGVCTAVLATTYAITNPIVVQRVQKEQFAAYFCAFYLLEADGETPKTGAVAEEMDVAADLLAKGINKKVQISYNGEVLGASYDGKVTGYGGDIIFQVSFRDGKYNSFTCLGHSETDGFGGVEVLKNLNDFLKDKDAASLTEASLNSGVVETTSGATSGTTRKNLVPAIIAAANDYVATK